MKEVGRFGPFVFHKINSGCLKKKEILKKEFETVGVMGEKYFQWKSAEFGKDIQNQIKFVYSFLIAFKIKQSKARYSLNLNLMNVSESDIDFSAAFLEGQMIDKQIKYNPCLESKWLVSGSPLLEKYIKPELESGGFSFFGSEYDYCVGCALFRKEKFRYVERFYKLLNFNAR